MATQLAQAGNHLLTELVMEIKSGNLRRCEALGLTDNEIRLLNSLTIEDLHYLSQSPVSIITCQIHRENLRLLLTRAKEVHRQNQMIERCLRLGASIDLLNQYFGMTSLEVSARRRLSGIREMLAVHSGCQMCSKRNYGIAGKRRACRSRMIRIVFRSWCPVPKK